MNSNFRNFAIWVFILLLLVALFNLFQSPGVHVRGNEISFSQLLSEVQGGNIQDVTIAGNQITGHFTDGRNFQTVARLPQGVRTEMGPDATGVGWVYQYALVDRSGSHSLRSASTCSAAP